MSDENEEEYTIIGSTETGSFSGKIPNDSPVTQILIGKRKSDEVAVATPDGNMLVKIVKVKQVQSGWKIWRARLTGDAP